MSGVTLAPTQIEVLLDNLPTYAKDLRLNYSTLVRQNSELSEQQLWGTILVSALATRNPVLTASILEEAKTHLSDIALEAAQAAAAIMAMNNVFYRFHHLSSNAKYAAMPAKLRMNVMRTHGVDGVDFELWSLAVSAINGCGKCIDTHEQVLVAKGITEEIILTTVRIASVVHGIGVVLDTAVHA